MAGDVTSVCVDIAVPMKADSLCLPWWAIEEMKHYAHMDSMKTSGSEPADEEKVAASELHTYVNVMIQGFWSGFQGIVLFDGTSIWIQTTYKVPK